MADTFGPNRVKELLKERKVAVGLESHTTDPALVEIMGWAGFDFVFIDTEHTPSDVGATATAIRACELTGMTPIVRVYENSPPLICKALDNGAQGVIVPHISTVSQAEAAVRAARFPPLGDRSACHSPRSLHYGLLPWKEYCHKANENTLVILLIESVEGVRNMPDILKIRGVDVILFGITDYSTSIGLSDEHYDNPTLYETLKDIVKMSAEAGVSVMTVTLNQSLLYDLSKLSYPRKIIDAGVKMIALGSDVTVFRLVCQGLIKIKELV